MNNEKHYIENRINENQDGMTVKHFLFNELKFSNRRVCAVKFMEDGILLNDLRVNVRAVLHTGDVLKVLASNNENRVQKLVPFHMDLSVLYEDQDILIVNKDAGVVTHPSRGHSADSLLNGIRFYLDEKSDYSMLHLVGRLDKDTSGALLVCKNSVSSEVLQKEKESSLFYKVYYALASGVFENTEGCIDIPMQGYHDEKENGKLKMKSAFDLSKGENENLPVWNAKTYYKVIRQFESFALLEVKIETGRMHQIRFHMSEINHPLLGDTYYGGSKVLYIKTPEETKEIILKRAMLHAYEIHFTHPVKSEEMIVLAPLSEDFLVVLNVSADYEKKKKIET